MKAILSLYYWIVGIIGFGCCSIIILLSLLTQDRRTTGKVTHKVFIPYLKLMGIDLTVEGQENLNSSKPFLIMGNHLSLFDIFVIPVAIPVPFVGIEAARHFSYPIFGPLTRKWGNIPIERSNLESAKKSIETARQTLKNGMNIAVLPEGHRTITGKMGEFKKGPFHLALHSEVDIVPFGMKGLYEYNRKGSFTIRPGRVVVKIGQPLRFSEISDLSVEQLRERVFDRIQKLSQ